MILREVFGILKDIFAPPQPNASEIKVVANPISDTPSVVVNVPDESFKTIDKELSPELKRIYDQDREERYHLFTEIKLAVTNLPSYKLSHVRGSKPIHYYQEYNTPDGIRRLYVCDVTGLPERQLELDEIETKRKVPCRKCHSKVLKDVKKIINVPTQVVRAVVSAAPTVISKSVIIKAKSKKDKRTSPMTPYQLKYIANMIEKEMKKTKHPVNHKTLVLKTGITENKIRRALRYMRRHKLLKTNGFHNKHCRYSLP